VIINRWDGMVSFRGGKTIRRTRLWKLNQIDDDTKQALFLQSSVHLLYSLMESNDAMTTDLMTPRYLLQDTCSYPETLSNLRLLKKPCVTSPCRLTYAWNVKTCLFLTSTPLSNTIVNRQSREFDEVISLL